MIYRCLQILCVTITSKLWPTRRLQRPSQSSSLVLFFGFFFRLRRLAIIYLPAPTRFVILSFVILILRPIQLRRIISVRIFCTALNPSALCLVRKTSIAVFYLKINGQKKKKHVPSLHRDTPEDIKHFFFFLGFWKNFDFPSITTMQRINKMVDLWTKVG